MKLKRIPPIQNKLVNVIIETPRSNQSKFDYDPESELFRLHKMSPAGTTFPFDFGFIPNTIGDNGNPVDALVIMDQYTYPGCLVQCRAIGVMEAEQIGKKKKKIRNDRVIAVAGCSNLYTDIINVKHLNTGMAKEIEHFFIDYNKYEGKQFRPLGWAGIRCAIKMIRQHSL